MQTDDIRPLSNPPARREIRPDFPRTISLNDAQEISATLERELEKHGTTLDQVGHVTLAYPHKHPGLFREHFDRAKDLIGKFLETVQKDSHLAAIDWLTADGLVETKKLDRSENQTSIHALMAHQIYDIHKPSQTTPLPFLEGREKEFFIIVDDVVSQGTTAANMLSYIEHNGGTVLAVAQDSHYPKQNVDIAQHETLANHLLPELAPRFGGSARNTERLPLLGFYLSGSAKKEGLTLTPDQCLDLLEKGLNKNGMSVYAMTNGESGRLLAEMRSGLSSFSLFMKELGVALPSAGKPSVSTAPAPKA